MFFAFNCLFTINGLKHSSVLVRTVATSFAVYFENESSSFVCLQKRVGISFCLWHISYKTWKVLGEHSFPVWYTCDLQLFTSLRVRVPISFFSISGKLWPLKFRNVFGAKSLSEHVNKRYNVTVAKSGNTEHAVVVQKDYRSAVRSGQDIDWRCDDCLNMSAGFLLPAAESTRVDQDRKFHTCIFLRI